MKLFASDFDFTFRIPEDDAIVAKNVIVANEFQAKGNIFAFVTGRDIDGIMRYSKELGVHADYFGCLNGSVIVDKDGKHLYSCTIEPSVIKEIIKIVKKHPIAMCWLLDGNKKRLVKLNRAALTKDFFKYHVSSFLRGDVSFCSIDKFVERYGACQLSCKFKDEKDIKKFEAEIQSLFGEYVGCHSNFHFTDIISVNASKGNAVKYLIDKLEIDEKNVYVIGDNYNDLSMIKMFNGYTVENANEEIKKVSSKIYRSVSEAIKAVEED